MNYSEFKTKHLGTKVDYDKTFGFQCVDLIKDYLFDVYGIKSGSLGNAAGIFEKTPKELSTFKKLVNTPTFLPLSGDIIIFKRDKSNGNYGHIAIVDEGTTLKDLYVIEQNAGTGNGDGKLGNSITRRKKNWKNILGFYRK